MVFVLSRNFAVTLFPGLARVTARTRDCLSRQVREAVLIRRGDKNILNGKPGWHQPALYREQQESKARRVVPVCLHS